MKQHNNNNNKNINFIIISSMFVTPNYGAHAPEKVVRK